MGNGSVSRIVQEIDDLLSDEKNLSTRTGLRLAFSVLRETVVIAVDLQDRVATIEKEHSDEKKKREKEADENQWLRRTVLGALMVAIALFLFNGVLFLFSTIPLIQKIIQVSQP